MAEPVSRAPVHAGHTARVPGPATRALEFRRFALPEFLLFLHPDMRSLPRELWVEMRGTRFPHVNAYWDGLAYVA